MTVPTASTTASANASTIDAELESGVATTTPPGDNLLNDFLTAEGAAYRSLAEQAGGRSASDDDLGLSMGDAGARCFFGNVAHATRPLGPDETGEAVRRLQRFYGASSGGPFLLFTPWSLGDLRGTGFVLAGHPPLMWRPDGPIDVAPAGDVGVVDARTPGEVAVFDRTLSEAYPAEALLPYGTQPPLFTKRIGETAWRLTIAYVGDEPVATAAVYASDHVAVVEAVATRPTVRGRGLGALVTASAVAAAPGRPAALLSSDEGRPVYARLGFVAVMRFTLWIGSR